MCIELYVLLTMSHMETFFPLLYIRRVIPRILALSVVWCNKECATYTGISNGHLYIQQI